MLLTQYCNQASWQTQKKHREQTCENFVLFSIGAHLLNGLPDSSKLRDENHIHFLHNVFLPAGITVVEKNLKKVSFCVYLTGKYIRNVYQQPLCKTVLQNTKIKFDLSLTLAKVLLADPPYQLKAISSALKK